MAGRPRKTAESEPKMAWDDVWSGNIDPATGLPRLPTGARWSIDIDDNMRADIQVIRANGYVEAHTVTAPSRTAILDGVNMLADHVSNIARLNAQFGGNYPPKKFPIGDDDVR